LAAYQSISQRTRETGAAWQARAYRIPSSLKHGERLQRTGERRHARPPQDPCSAEISTMNDDTIAQHCTKLGSATNRGELAREIAAIALSYSPTDLKKMRWNFSGSLQGTSPEYRRRLEEMITGHLHGTYQALLLAHRQGTYAHQKAPLHPDAGRYWTMVATQCSHGNDEQIRLRFLKFLLAAFCMFVQDLPAHPVGMPFPGGDTVASVDGVYYCPVREKANDVDAALCPFCPALQTPEMGYLRPPINPSKQRKQEYLRQCHDFHHFNG